jgi:hypothetical protein
MRKLMILLLCLLVSLPMLAQDDDTNSDVIEVGDTDTGRLTHANPLRAYTFTGEGDANLLITLVSEDFDTFLVLRDSNGQELTQDDDSGPGSLDSRIGPYTLPQDGAYTLVVDSYSHHFNTNGGIEIGDYELTVAMVESQPIMYTQTQPDEIDEDTPEMFYEFEGQRGDLVTISMESQDFNSRVRVLQSDNLLAQSDSFVSGTDTAVISGLALPETGDYIIAAGSVYTQEFGAFELTLTRTDVTPLEYGASVDAEITAQDRLLFYSFDGAAGEIVDIRVEGDNDFDTTLTINDPEGNQVAYQDDSFNLDPAITDLVLAVDGRYTVLVQPYQVSGTGDVTISLNRGELLSLDDGTQALDLNEGNTRETISFSGAEGQHYRLTVTVAQGETASPNMTITQGQTTLSSTTATGIRRQSIDFTAFADEVIYVQFEDYTYGDITLQVELETIDDE